jgi:hypothetical protein
MVEELKVVFSEDDCDIDDGILYYVKHYRPGEDVKYLEQEVVQALYGHGYGQRTMLEVSTTGEQFRWSDYHKAVERITKDNTVYLIVTDII